jgi:hypothetical protein
MLKPPKIREVSSMADSEIPGSSSTGSRASLSPEDKRLALVTFTATLAANVATLVVAGVALLAYHLGPRLASADGGAWMGGLALGYIVLVLLGHRVSDRWFLAGEKTGRLGRVIWILYLCADALGFVFLLFFILGKLISVK